MENSNIIAKILPQCSLVNISFYCNYTYIYYIYYNYDTVSRKGTEKKIELQ